MSALRARIAELIETTGPISVSQYWALCLYDPIDGYYMTREPFGRGGDFTTAPEVSQMFGEMVALWVHGAWQAAGAPQRFVLAEIGPGRGTLMKDMLRTLAKAAPALVDAAEVRLVEVSPRLRAVQADTLAGATGRIGWDDRVEQLPEGPLVIVGNEIFDALPIRQYVKAGGRWRERMVALDGAGNLAFHAGAGMPDPALLPPDAADAAEGAIAELSPARAGLMDIIASRIAGEGGAGLFLDYGYLSPSTGDTLQALHRHAPDDSLAHPGEADLTSHVDFAALAEAARAHGLRTAAMTQADFLLAMGLLERAGRLGTPLDEAGRDRIRADVERLAGPQQMGDLFKALCVGATTPLPAPFEA